MSHYPFRRGLFRTMVAVCLIGGMSTAALAQVRIGVGIALPGVRIGVNIPTSPQLVPVPGYPVYYAPQLDTNLFFYGGGYWLFANDNWYRGSGYNGPWYAVSPAEVPVYILRVPVRYYRRPPAFFRGWSSAVAPRWGEHWGAAWQRSRPNWNRREVPQRAPLRRYQRNTPRARYPEQGRQRAEQNRYRRNGQRQERNVRGERGRQPQNRRQNNRRQNKRQPNKKGTQRRDNGPPN